MTRLTELLTRRPRLVLVVAILLTLISFPLASKQEDRLRAGDTTATSADSASVTNEIAAGKFPGAVGAPLSLVLRPNPGATSADLIGAIKTAGQEISTVSGVGFSQHGEEAAIAQATVAPQAFVILRMHYGGGTGIDQARALMRKLNIANPNPGVLANGKVQVYMIGEGALWAALIETASTQTKTAERNALPLTLLVLLVIFGSIAAALLPLAVGVVSVAVAGAIVYLLSYVTDVSIFASTIAAMVGLGVAIDYSMFIVVRYREEIAAGLHPDAARARTMATSGRAIAYSGLTVGVSQSALFLIASPGVRSIGAGTIIVVAVSVLVASTVLPVLLGLMGPRAYQPGKLAQWLSARRWRLVGEGFWERWAGIVMSHPIVCLIAASAVMLAIAAPTLDLTVRNSAADQLPANNEVRLASLLVAKHDGPGVLAPMQITVEGTPGHVLQSETVARVVLGLHLDPAIASVSRVDVPKGANAALITALLRPDPESQIARDTVDRLRKDLSNIAAPAKVAVGGATAVILDFDRLLSSQMWRPILFVLIVTFLVLFMLLRSFVLPLKAAIMNLMSVLASYGALVAVFKWGWLAFLGIHKADTLYPVTLPLILTICSGLSMDYHIFLLSRIQERYLATGDTRKSVGEGLASSASAITSAALIMVIVFLAFVVDGTPSSQQVGFAAAVSIALDATLVRLIIVPAAMELLGDWNWWLPSGLARFLAARVPLHVSEPAVAMAGAGAVLAVVESPPAAANGHGNGSGRNGHTVPVGGGGSYPSQAPERDESISVRIEGLTKEYGTGDGRVEALKGINLNIARGEFVAIMGPSGSGKSTLMHILGALESPSGGSVDIDGVSYAGLSDKEQTDLRLDHIGFAFQFFNLLKSLNAEENVMLPSLVAGERSSDQLQTRARELLDLVGLSARSEHLPSQMSGGEQQRVSIARSLMREPKLLLADEPTGNLDTENSAAVMDLLSRLGAETGQTIVMVTHDPVAASRATRVVFLHDGLIAGEMSGGDSDRIVKYFVELDEPLD